MEGFKMGKENKNKYNAGCYRKLEDGSYMDVTKTVEQSLESPQENMFAEFTVRIVMLYFLITVFALMFLQGCTNGQLCVGMSEYNQNKESRSFDVRREDK